MNRPKTIQLYLEANPPEYVATIENPIEQLIDKVKVPDEIETPNLVHDSNIPEKILVLINRFKAISQLLQIKKEKQLAIITKVL
jgi:hypothetical protein